VLSSFESPFAAAGFERDLWPLLTITPEPERQKRVLALQYR